MSLRNWWRNIRMMWRWLITGHQGFWRTSGICMTAMFRKVNGGSLSRILYVLSASWLCTAFTMCSFPGNSSVGFKKITTCGVATISVSLWALAICWSSSTSEIPKSVSLKLTMHVCAGTSVTPCMTRYHPHSPVSRSLLRSAWALKIVMWTFSSSAWLSLGWFSFHWSSCMSRSVIRS